MRWGGGERINARRAQGGGGWWGSLGWWAGDECGDFRADRLGGQWGTLPLPPAFLPEPLMQRI